MVDPARLWHVGVGQIGSPLGQRLVTEAEYPGLTDVLAAYPS